MINKDCFKELKEIYEYQKFSRYIDGFAHGYILSAVLFILLGVCIYFSK